MPKILLALILLTAYLPFSGQTNWLKREGGNTVDEALSISSDEEGNLYSTGYFNNFAVFQGQGIVTNGFSDFFISKHDADGEMLWTISGGGPNPDRGYSIDTDPSGFSVVTGFFTGEMEFLGETYVSPTDSRDMFILKIDPSGALMWFKTLGLSLDDTPYQIHLGHEGSVYLAAQIQGTGVIEGVDITTTNYENTTEPSADVLFVKYDSNGEFQWLKYGGDNEDDRWLAIATNDGGDIFLTGEFSENITFDQTYSNTVENACFIMKVDQLGNEEWFDILAAYEVLIRDCVTNLEGNPVILLDHIGLVNLQTQNGNQQIAANYDYNYSLIQLEANGDYTWHTSEGSLSQISSRDLARHTDGTLTVVGDYQCSFTSLASDWGEGLFYSVGFNDIFTCKHAADGERLWEHSFGGPFEENCAGVEISIEGYPVLAGGFENLINLPVVEEDADYDTANNIDAEWTDGNVGQLICGTEDYGSFLSSQSSGGFDIFYANFYHPDRPVYDYFKRDNGCFHDYLLPEIQGGVDTISGCLGSSDLVAFADTKTGSSGLYGDLSYIGPGYNFLWSNGDVESSSTLSSGTNWVIVTRKDECASFTDTIEAVVFPLPNTPCIDDTQDQIENPEASVHSLTMCLPDSLILYPCEPDTTLDYSWDWSGDDPVELEGDSLLVSGTGLYNYMATNEYGCSTQSFNFIAANYQFNPIEPELKYIEDGSCSQGFVFVENDSITVCPGEHVMAVLFDPLDPYDFIESTVVSSYFSGPQINALVTSSCFKFGFEPGADGWYTIELEFVHGVSCPNYYTVEASIHVTLVDEITGPLGGFLCPGVPNELSINGANEVTWSGPSGAYWEVTSPTSIDAYDAGTYVATATFEEFDLTCDVATTLQNMELPSITMEPEDGIICPDEYVQLNAPNGLDWAWIGPAGDIIDVNQYAFVDGPGDYHCIVTDSSGCALESNFLELQQYSSPFIYSEQGLQFCSLDPIQISIETNPVSVIEWSPPLVSNDPEVLIAQPGTYQVSVTLCDITNQLEITLEPSDTPSEITLDDPGVMCEGDGLTLFANAGMENYSWDPVNLSQDSLVVFEPGPIVLYTTDEEGCVGVSDTLWVEEYIVELAGLENIIACFETDVNIEVNTISNLEWFYAETDSSPFSSDNPLQIENLDGELQLFYSIQDSVCTSPIQSVFLDTYPVSEAPQLPDLAVCWGENAEIFSPNGAPTYWLGGPYSEFTLADILEIDNVISEVDVQVFEIDENGCESEIGEFLIYPPILGNVADIVESGEFCVGDELNLYSSLVAQTMFWTTPTGSVLSEEIQIDELTLEDAGIYSLALSDEECLVYSDSVLIEVSPYPEFEITDDSFYCWDGLYHVFIPSGSDYYLWNNVPGDTVLVIDFPGVYEITAGNLPGCERDADFVVDDIPCDPAPNVITINGDQHNDYIDFTFFFGNFDEIIIYNRWGGIVSTHTPTNSIWHGLDDNGRRVAEGVYYYGVTKNGVARSYYLHVFHD